MSAPVVIVEYDPDWPRQYEEERQRIVAAIGDCALGIEHVGSTAVPGLAAKPIIDIMVGVRRLEDAQQCMESLAGIGYIFQPDDTIPERVYFNKGPADRHRHLHMTELGGQFWQDHLLFRDYLRAHPDSAAAYAALKRELADRFTTDRIGYTDAKTEFIQSVVRKARQDDDTVRRNADER